MPTRHASVVALLAILVAAGCSLSWEGPQDDGGAGDVVSDDGNVGPDGEDSAPDEASASDDAAPPDVDVSDRDEGGREEADGPTDGVEDATEPEDADGEAETDVRSCASSTDCDDENPCTNDICMPGSFCVWANVGDGTACNDDLFCNGDDRCSSGVCEHVGNPCSVTVACDEANDWCDCDDANGCTDDDHVDEGMCIGNAAAAQDRVCGRGCDSSECDHCCGGSCVSVRQNTPCGNCAAACTSPPESCRYSSTAACGWLWCCGT